MSYLVLARKWRPMSFDDLVGQDHVSRTLANAIAHNRVAHAFLFTGVRGVGKTTSARILAKALNCMTSDGPTHTPCLNCLACKEIAEGHDVDVQEIDGASYNGVDEVRKLQESLPYRPSRDRYKIIIVDEVHMLSSNAWNAFLKTLEEPPPHVKFIFATTEAHKVPVTILSRVQRFDFKLIPPRLIADRLRYVLDQEQLLADDAALSIIARQAAGSMRDAMSLLDQVIAWSDSGLSGDDVSRVLGVASRQALQQLAGALIGGDPAQALELVSQLANQGFDMSHVARDLLALLRDVVVAANCAQPEELLDLPEDDQASVAELAKHDPDDLLRVHQAISRGFDEVSRGGQPRAALEMLLVRVSRRPPLVPIADLIERLIKLEKRIYGATPSASGTGSVGGTSRRGEALTESPRSGATRRAPLPSAEDRPPSAHAPTLEADQPRPDRPAATPSAKVFPRGPALPGETAIAPSSGDVNGGASTPRAALASTHANPPSPLTPPSSSDVRSNAPVPGSAAASDAESPSRPLTPPSPSDVRSSAPAPGSAAASDAESPSRPLTSSSPSGTSTALPAGEPEALSNWRQVLNSLRDGEPQLAAFLAHAEVLCANRDQVELRYESSSILADTLRGERTAQKIGDVMERLWGKRPEIALRETTERITGSTVLLADKRERELRTQQAIEAAKKHPTVVEAMSVLGARVKNIEIPEQ